MKNWFRILAFMLVICSLLTACGSNGSDNQVNKSENAQQNSAAEPKIPHATEGAAIPEDYTDKNGNVYKTIDADELCLRIQAFEAGTLAPEDYYFQMEMKITNDGVHDLDDRLYIGFSALEPNEKVNDERTAISAEGYCFSEAYLSDERMADVCLDADAYEAMRTVWDELGMWDIVIVRGKIVSSHGGTFYFSDDTKGYCQSLNFAVVDLVKIKDN